MDRFADYLAGERSSFSQLPLLRDVGGEITDQEREIAKEWGLGL